MDVTLIDDFIKEVGINIHLSKTKRIYHDRFILIDENILYLSGPFIKDAGNGIGMILEVDNKQLIKCVRDAIKELANN